MVRYPDDATIDTDQVAEMVTSELSREITTEGQTVRVTARYNRDDVGYNPDDGDDSDDGQDGDGTDDGDAGGQNETDDQNMDSETNESEDNSESSDGSGPGFGVFSAVSGLGGAGYLLSRRVGDDEE